MPHPSSPPQIRETDAMGDAWVRYAMLALLLAAIAVSGWNVVQVNRLKASLPDIVKNEMAAARPSDIFMSMEEGWGVGQYAPDVPVTTIDGNTESLRDLAHQYDVIYVAWDECKVCQAEFPTLAASAAKLKASGRSIAVVSLMTKSSLGALKATYQWDFPLYAIDQRSLLELNLAGTPDVLVFRNGVLGEAHSDFNFLN